jgi:hypothetical protein
MLNRLSIHQPPHPEALHHYLTQTYPGADYVCACKCGKFSYWMQHKFIQLGIECLVANPADIPNTHNKEVYKTGSRDGTHVCKCPSSIQKPLSLFLL